GVLHVQAPCIASGVDGFAPSSVTQRRPTVQPKARRTEAVFSRRRTSCSGLTRPGSHPSRFVRLETHGTAARSLKSHEIAPPWRAAQAGGPSCATPPCHAQLDPLAAPELATAYQGADRPDPVVRRQGQSDGQHGAGDADEAALPMLKNARGRGPRAS